MVWSTFAAIHAHVKPADYYVFWEAARHWQAPYDPALITALEARLHITGAWPFAYPPTFLLLAWPFAQMPLSLAYPLWTGVSAALFTYAAAHLIRPSWAALALFIVPPVVLAVSPGQTSLIVGAAMIAGWLWREERPRLAGLAFAAAVCIKPQAMILAPVVLWGQWRLVRWALIGMPCAGAGELRVRSGPVAPVAARARRLQPHHAGHRPREPLRAGRRARCSPRPARSPASGSPGPGATSPASSSARFA